MTLRLKQVMFEHLPDLSVYNNNLFKHKEIGYIIREICHEDEDYYEFFLLEETMEVFLGCSQKGFNGENLLEIDFKYQYT